MSLHGILLWTHSLNRWLVLLLLFVAIVRCAQGLFQKKEWTATQSKIHVALIATVHTQVLLGLLLYMGISPLMGVIFKDFGSAMKDAMLRFWAVEHIFLMCIALVLIHGAHVMVKKAEEPAQKFKRGLIGFSFGLLCILVAIPWPFREALGRSLLPA